MAKKSIKKTLPCYATHPPMPLVMDGKPFNVYGGSCLHPVHTDSNVLVGLDIGMTTQAFNGSWAEHPHQVYFPIRDMSVPDDVAKFKTLITGLVGFIKEGKKVHIGCIGGHGRTGLVLAAIVKVGMGLGNAIDYVRKNYCEHAVETYEQEQWLKTHFGISAPETVHAKVSMFPSLQGTQLNTGPFRYNVNPVAVPDNQRIL